MKHTEEERSASCYLQGAEEVEEVKQRDENKEHTPEEVKQL